MEIFNQKDSKFAQNFIDNLVMENGAEIFSQENRSALFEKLNLCEGSYRCIRDLIVMLVSLDIPATIFEVKTSGNDTVADTLSRCITLLISRFGIADFYAKKMVSLIASSLGMTVGPKSFDVGEFIDSRDGEVYKTTRIGNRVWLAENFKFEVDKGCFVYKDDYSDFYERGNLYTFEAAKIAVPEGWRLPTKADFQSLIKTTLKSIPANDGSWVSGNLSSDSPKRASLRDLLASKKWNGLDLVGFAADCCGYRYGTGYFGDGKVAVFWSSSEEIEHAYALSISDAGVKIECNLKECAYPIRLVKDL